MPTTSGKHPIEIPQALWDALDEAAQVQRIPTAQLAADWLWQHMRERFKEPQFSHLEMPPKPYDRFRVYSRHGMSPRRDPAHLQSEQRFETPLPPAERAQAETPIDKWRPNLPDLPPR